ncbi:MAG: PDZ domain-containing protein, partial [Candidatus Eisenbacteria bacterium]|nr:PDZ domain-containing protein [Candidatus Eisenbacteria bacterium]
MPVSSPRTVPNQDGTGPAPPASIGDSTMRYLKSLAMAAAVLAIGVSAFAGEGSNTKCDSSTQECLDYMAQKMKDSGWVGIEMEQVEEGSGWSITKVVPGSPAEAGGMQPGDVLFAMYGIELNEANQ